MKILSAILLLVFPIAASPQAKFRDADSGISFRYPGAYKLTKGELGQNDRGLVYLAAIPMEFSEPGGVRIATVEAPENAYPGTDFVNSFVTVSVNRFETADECAKFGDYYLGEDPVEKRIGGVLFHGIEVGAVAMNHQFDGDYYHAFIRGECVEVGEGVASAGFGAIDGIVRYPAKRVFGGFEKIIRSIALNVPPDPSLPPSPAIACFQLTPDGEVLNRYRVSWKVRGANANSLWLTMNGVAQALAQGFGPVEEFATDTPNGLFASAGSMEMELRELNGQDKPAQIRLFVSGQAPVSRTITITPACMAGPSPCR